MSEDTRLKLAKELVSALEQGEQVLVEQLLDELASLQKMQLFQEVCKLTRQLHNTLVFFVADPSITAFTEQDIPDTKARLNHVITMTEQAANQTLTVVEQLLPLAELLRLKTQQFSDNIKGITSTLPAPQLVTLNEALSGYVNTSNAGLATIHNGLTDILLAQGYQDITGQTIRKVIAFVQVLEESMVSLIRETGYKKAPVVNSVLPGPNVPGVDDKAGDVACSQDEVDDLLSSLGF